MGFPPENKCFWHKYGITLPYLFFSVKKPRSFAGIFLNFATSHSNPQYKLVFSGESPRTPRAQAGCKSIHHWVPLGIVYASKTGKRNVTEHK